MEKFLTGRGIRNPEWITVKESESSQVEKKFLFKTSEENQNGLMARPLQSKLRCLRYKVLVRDQLWKCHVDQMHQTNRTSRSQRRTFPRSSEPLFFKVAHESVSWHRAYWWTHGYVTSLLVISAIKNKVTFLLVANSNRVFKTVKGSERQEANITCQGRFILFHQPVCIGEWWNTV